MDHCSASRTARDRGFRSGAPPRRDGQRPAPPGAETISPDAPATRLGICIGSVHKLIRKSVLPAAQLMPSAPWQIPVAALDTEAVKTGVREIVGRRPKFYKRFQEDKTLQLPGF